MCELQNLMDSLESELDEDMRSNKLLYGKIKDDSSDSTENGLSRSADSNRIKRHSSSASISGMCAKYVTTKHTCKSGENLMLVNDNNLYNGELACCDLCRTDIAKDKQFFHCMADNHKFGYDLCTECVFKATQSSTRKPSDDEDGLLLFAYDSSKPTRRKRMRRRKQKKFQKTGNKQSKKEDTTGQNVKELKRENRLLAKQNGKQIEKIKYLEHQLQLITKDKLENETTLKFVKKKVSNLILTNEQINRDLSVQQKQNAKLKPDGQWKLLCQLDANFKASKKSQVRKNKK